MARTSANLKVLAAEVGRVQERLHRGADEAKTLRKVVPFKELEQRAAERRAGSMVAPPWKQPQTQDDTHLGNESEKAPDSGVRGLENHALSYTVYSVAELEARPRTSVPPPPSTQVPSIWPDVGRSGKSLLRAWWSFYVRAKPRPQMMDVCRVPLMQFQVDLVAALKTLPWRKIGVRAGITFASIIALLFITITIAELTDDLKPSRTASTTEKKVDSKPEVSQVLPAAVTLPAPAEPAFEIDETPVPAKKPAVVAKTKPAAPSSRPKKKKGPDIFNP